ncbi:MAG TPA: DnaA N-terminal domain-containing protein [Anaerolineales bacterium]|nr:DnaA N-terminal domain-containing protein [Anaerolineales bacterium]
MNYQQAWGSVLGQLQMDMPRASFDTWVHDTEAISLEEDVLTVATCNAYARDWLESRLTSTVQRLLIGILNQTVSVRFIVRDVQEEDLETEEDEQEQVAIEAVGWLDYDRIVQPHKQVVVKGYLRRLGMEMGPKAVWLYIGFHQAAWMVHTKGKESSLALHSSDIMRFSGLSFGAFWRTLRNEKTRSDLNGLVQRMEAPQERHYHRGRDGRPHRRPVRYQVCMTPRLTRADAIAVHARLKTLLEDGTSLLDALQQLLAVEDVMELLTPIESIPVGIPCNTVMDMARLEADEKFSPEIDHLAQELHRRIINCLGDIHITHYFITETIQRYNLTPAQAWLITVARDMAYLNSRTGERREVVTFKRGYEEMAELVGSKRYKTVQAWLNRDWTTQQRGGDLNRFLLEVEPSESRTYSDLRVDSMPRAFRVLLDEPLDANGSNTVDAGGSNMSDANGRISRTQMEALVGANGSNMVDANGTALNSFKHPLSTDKKNTSTTHPLKGTDHDTRSAEAAPAFWELKTLLQQNDVHPKVQKELLEARASVHAFVSWVLYVASPQSGKLSNPLGYAISRLREHALREARGVFRQFANLPPAELLMLIDSTPTHAYELPAPIEHPLAHAWKQAMGSNNPSLALVRVILFGEGENQ